MAFMFARSTGVSAAAAPRRVASLATPLPPAAACRRRGLASAPDPPPPPPPPPGGRPPRTNAFKSALPEVLATAGWEGAWQRGVTPWEVGAPHAAIAGVVAALPEFAPPRRGALRVLVPGCGSGWDAFGFVRAGFPHVTAVDLSPTAVERCRDAAAGQPDLAAAAAAGALVVQQADFFAMGADPAHAGRYDVVWDYLFSSALPPDRRGWAAAAAALLRPGGGQLLACLFPVGDFAGGPPFAVRPPAYAADAAAAGLREAALAPLPPALSHPARAGREWLGRFVRE